MDYYLPLKLAYSQFLLLLCQLLLTLSTNPVRRKSSRHIDIRVHFCRELYTAGVMRLILEQKVSLLSLLIPPHTGINTYIGSRYF